MVPGPFPYNMNSFAYFPEKGMAFLSGSQPKTMTMLVPSSFQSPPIIKQATMVTTGLMIQPVTQALQAVAAGQPIVLATTAQQGVPHVMQQHIVTAIPQMNFVSQSTLGTQLQVKHIPYDRADNQSAI
jgi:hypothetical protein